MSMIFFEMGPALAVIATLLAGVAGAYFRGKAHGKADVRAEINAKTNQQAANAGKEIRNVDAEIDRLPDSGAADQLKRDWLRKSVAVGAGVLCDRLADLRVRVDQLIDLTARQIFKHNEFGRALCGS